MPGGRRNPLSMSNMLEQLGEVVQNTKEKVQNANDSIHSQTTHTKTTITKKMGDHGHLIPYVDVVIQFIGASGLPKMDVVGSADPYLVAQIDDQISFVSQVKQNTLSPVWNEIWRVKNVPAIADLHIKLMDKDEGIVTDDYIGKAKTSVSAGAKELEIEGPILHLRRNRGTMWVKIESHPAQDEDPVKFPYLFDGPIRFSRHYSPTVGALTNLDQARLYSTWKLYLKGIPLFFGDTYQGWNKHYKAAQSIFRGPTAVAVRSGIQAGHRLLYARTASNGFGVITSGVESGQKGDHAEEGGIGFTQLLLHDGGVDAPVRPAWTGSRSSLLSTLSNTRSRCSNSKVSSSADNSADQSSEPPTSDGIDQASANASASLNAYKEPSSSAPPSPFANRIKPAVYTYIISADDDSFRFSETGAAFFVDFASKHALHSNCATKVRYSGEFHPRPEGGWANFNDSTPDSSVNWELVIDNNSGTYAPDKGMLPALQKLLSYNFPGLKVFALDHDEDELKQSREACRDYAVQFRGIGKEELQPHIKEGEETLWHHAAGEIGKISGGEGGKEKDEKEGK
ncbi:hypothetical protein D9613_003520 [Agrocybe pediades]|uniref:C2 domain-containing protein n=1 Tax=Agrocybe pediades TaxID=84607 RepID=A0A8H4QNJ1_9AGAR|nr:hypothetical protein D9613_003520 [Agrocybe pediades]